MKLFKIKIAIIIAILLACIFIFENKASSEDIKTDIKTSMSVRIIHEKTKRSIKDEIKYIFGNNWRIAYAVMMSEGRLNVKAKHRNKDRLKTLDRGLFQLNDYWHSEVSDKCAYDMECNIKEAYRISKKGTKWGEWYGYKNGNYLDYL